MAIYRPPKPRLPAIVAAAVVGLLVGLGAGYLLGGAGRSDPRAAAGELRRSLTAASAPLGVVTTEYGQGVRRGRVVDGDGYAGARGAVVRSRSRFDEARPALEALAPQRAATITRAYEKLGRLIDDRDASADVARAVDDLKRLLEA